MTVPPPREEPSWGDLVVDGLRDIREDLAALRRDMSSQMSLLVSQREFDHTRDELKVDITGLRSKVDSAIVRHDADIESVRKAAEANVRALKAEMDAAEQRRRTERWAALGAFLTITGLALTVIFHYM